MPREWRVGSGLEELRVQAVAPAEGQGLLRFISGEAGTQDLETSIPGRSVGGAWGFNISQVHKYGRRETATHGLNFLI